MVGFLSHARHWSARARTAQFVPSHDRLAALVSCWMGRCGLQVVAVLNHLQTCHYERINDVCFPEGYSELFATCSNHDIRIWNARTSTELLRIQVQNLECNCVCFSPDGKSIVSGWSDGKIRAFGPQSGRLLYVINDAHKTQGMKRVSGNLSGVTALAVSHDNTRLISGGADSQVLCTADVVRKGFQGLGLWTCPP